MGHMVSCGLCLPTTVRSTVPRVCSGPFRWSSLPPCQSAAGFIAWPTSKAKLPDEKAPGVLAHLYAIRDAPTLDAARVAVDGFSNRYQDRFPVAVACFEEDREALLLAIHKVPVRHRIRVRTTNLAEDSFQEERRRTKVIPRLRDEKAALKDGLCQNDPSCLSVGAESRSTTFSVINSPCCASSSDSTHYPARIKPLGTATPTDKLRPQVHGRFGIYRNPRN